MATQMPKKGQSKKTTKKASVTSKLSAKSGETNAKLKEYIEKTNTICTTFETLTQRQKLEVLTMLGCGKDFFVCHRCGNVRHRTELYVSTEPGITTGVTSICKDCANDIASPVIDGVRQSPTKQTVDDALYALNKPFLESVWDSSLLEAANNISGKQRSNVWNSYIKNIQMMNYYMMTYRQSDNYTGGLYSIADQIEKDEDAPKEQEVLDQFEKNKADTLKLLGYLPFEKEKVTDQPFLYSQLIGFLDSSEEGNDDMMRVSSIISIVRGFLQINQIDDMIAELTRDIVNVDRNLATIKGLQDMKKNITANVAKLAEQSCISLKNSKHSVKGENTWTGKIKKIQDLDLRQGRVNGFDIATCRGMKQVQEISDASIMKQLRLDESEWSDMVAQMRENIVSLRDEKDNYKEINRILLQENLDLKDFLEESNVVSHIDFVDLRDLYSVFKVEENDEVVEKAGESDESDSSTI